MRSASSDVNDDNDEKDPTPTLQEIESFYRNKISEINRQHEESVRMLKFRLKRLECHSADDEYMVSGNHKDVFLIIRTI